MKSFNFVLFLCCLLSIKNHASHIIHVVQQGEENGSYVRMWHENGVLHFKNCFLPHNKHEHPFCRNSLFNCSTKTPEELESMVLPHVCLRYVESGAVSMSLPEQILASSKKNHAVYRSPILGMNHLEFLLGVGPLHASRRVVAVSDLYAYKRELASVLLSLLPENFKDVYPSFVKYLLKELQPPELPPHFMRHYSLPRTPPYLPYNEEVSP